MKPSLVIWDWNGTLMDDLALCNHCLNQLLTENGYPQQYDRSSYQEIFGFPIIDYYRKAGFDFERHSFEELAARYMEIYLPAATQCGLCPGAHQALTAIQSAGIPQIILSASPMDTLQKQVAAFGLSDFFDKLLGQDNIYAHSKKEAGLAFMAEQAIDPTHVVMIGDTLHDFEVASAMGIQSILCAAGHQSRARLQSCGAQVIDTLYDLPKLLTLSQ